MSPPVIGVSEKWDCKTHKRGGEQRLLYGHPTLKHKL